MAAFAEYGSDVKSDYARANHRLVRSLGRPWGGRPPLGYYIDPAERSYLVSQERAAIIRDVYKHYLAGASQYEIARELNDNGRQRPSGKPWTCQQIGRVLDDPAYAALCIVDNDFVDGVWEAIVDRDTWGRVRPARAKDKRRHRQLRLAKGGPYLLTGLLHCGYCDEKLYHRSRKKVMHELAQALRLTTDDFDPSLALGTDVRLRLEDRGEAADDSEGVHELVSDDPEQFRLEFVCLAEPLYLPLELGHPPTVFRHATRQGLIPVLDCVL